MNAANMPESLQPTTHRTDAPERALIFEVLLVAVADSLGGRGRRRVDDVKRERARRWLRASPVCELYCDLIDINYHAMRGRLRAQWQG